MSRGVCIHSTVADFVDITLLCNFKCTICEEGVRDIS